MKASKQNFIIDILAFVFFIFLTTTGIIVHYVLPAGSGHGRTVWGWDRHDWGDLHFYMAVGFLLILAFHLFKHWKWIWCLLRGRKREQKGRRALLGTVGLIAVLIIAFLPVVTPVQDDGSKKGGGDEHTEQVETPFIKGSMSLKEVEKLTGVPATYIIEKMKLPKSTPINERLKDLKDTYGFEMEAVRELVADYKRRN